MLVFTYHSRCNDISNNNNDEYSAAIDEFPRLEFLFISTQRFINNIFLPQAMFGKR